MYHPTLFFYIALMVVVLSTLNAISGSQGRLLESPLASSSADLTTFLLRAAASDPSGAKRAPSYRGFMGLRGKKWSNSNSDDLQEEGGHPSSSSAVFSGGNHDDDDEDVNEVDRDISVAASVTDNDEEQMYKRAFNNRFLVLRGTKDDAVDDLAGAYEKKRIPTGFVGLRGKKRLNFPFLRSSKSDYSDKRAPIAFMGMRGKKSMLDNKRVPSGFYGLRG